MKDTFLACEICQAPRSGAKETHMPATATIKEKEEDNDEDDVVDVTPRDGRRKRSRGTEDVSIPSDRGKRCKASTTTTTQRRDMSSQPWYLVRFDGLPTDSPGNANTVTFSDIVRVPTRAPHFVVISTFQISIPWLLSKWPAITSVKRVVIVHGEDLVENERMKRQCPNHFEIVSRSPKHLTFGTHPRTGKPIRFFRGCHHTKFMMIGYKGYLRFVVHTAALDASFSTCTQGAYVQDFPKKTTTSTCAFETTLVDYVKSYEATGSDMSEPTVWPGFGNNEMTLSGVVSAYDFSSARAHLLASVPGYHVGSHRDKWGHPQVARLLLARNECPARPSSSDAAANDVIVAQFTSFASATRKYRDELATSFSAGNRSDDRPMGRADLEFVWPTCDEVVRSVYGVSAGGVMPGDLKDSRLAQNEGVLRTWGSSRSCASNMVRARRYAMPHIKTFTRASADGTRVDWSILTSCNISGSAWGRLQLNGSQLCIRSWEMGVLFTPATLRRPSDRLPTLVTTQHVDEASSTIVVPLPFALPTRPYEESDVPWHWKDRGKVSGPAIKLFCREDATCTNG